MRRDGGHACLCTILYSHKKAQKAQILTMPLYVGTSGYSYKEWKGRFYPPALPAKEMLSYYASGLHAVELNNTFYRMPQPSMIESWKTQVPDDFQSCSAAACDRKCC